MVNKTSGGHFTFQPLNAPVSVPHLSNFFGAVLKEKLNGICACNREASASIHRRLVRGVKKAATAFCDSAEVLLVVPPASRSLSSARLSPPTKSLAMPSPALAPQSFSGAMRMHEPSDPPVPSAFRFHSIPFHVPTSKTGRRRRQTNATIAVVNTRHHW